MTYIPRAVLERQKWLTLPEAISHIIDVEKCARNDALGQLLDALVDEAVRTIWALPDDRLNSQDPTRWYRSILPHYSALELWMTASINLETQLIRFPHTSISLPIGCVWLLRESVLEIWNEHGPEERAEKASDDEVLKALRDIFKDVASGKEKRWDLNDLHKWVERRVDPKKRPKKEVLKLFWETPEFAKYKRERGRPRKKKISS
jgi:hypothetical protein